MAGDKKGEQRGVIRQQGDYGRGLSTDFRTGTLEPQVRMFRDQYFQPAAQQQMQDYGRIMGGYNNFAETGGFSPQDLGNIRSRALSPTRAVYANAQRNVNRQRSLQGGYSPGFGTLQGRLAREGSQAASDAATNAEAAIAQMVQQGKLAGLSGGANLYGTTPGMAATFGNQVLNATGQLGSNIGNEMDFASRIIGAQQNAQELPGKWEGTLGRIGDIGRIATGIASIPWGGGGGFMGTKLPFYATGF